MCLLLISYESHSKYKLIIAANRDEFYNRPAEPAKFWENYPSLLAGKDLQAGGTWLGITKQGRFAAITNYRDMKNLKKDAPSRGELVTNFLTANDSPKLFSENLLATVDLYNGYNLLFTDLHDFFYFSNQTKKSVKLTSGSYGLSNHLLDTPWHKVETSKKSFKKILNKEDVSSEDLFEILSDTSTPPDDLLPNTGLMLEIERAVSPVFVATPFYGTRSSTVIFIDRNNQVKFTEKSLNTKTKEWNSTSFNFKIK
ncbi:MAG: NRDE family protein [Bacteroidetes bacterium]|nr:NRDE family protein [Bacteroidota bacterium]